jgi:hypothetical protein
MMLNRVDECPQRADECRRSAAQIVADDVLRGAYLDLARHWRNSRSVSRFSPPLAQDGAPSSTERIWVKHRHHAFITCGSPPRLFFEVNLKPAISVAHAEASFVEFFNRPWWREATRFTAASQQTDFLMCQNKTNFSALLSVCIDFHQNRKRANLKPLTPAKRSWRSRSSPHWLRSFAVVRMHFDPKRKSVAEVLTVGRRASTTASMNRPHRGLPGSEAPTPAKAEVSW